jgi:membrane dipeptidase
MYIKRRDFIKTGALGAILPGSILDINNRLSVDHMSLASSWKFEDQIVIDGLIISRGWDEDSFDALTKSGYTGFNTSLDSTNLKSALSSLEDWRNRIKNKANRLIHATSGKDFITAKKENKVGVMFGFQNATMIEQAIDNLDILYAAGTRWIQLTYNERNLLGDGCTERTNAGLSDFGIEAVARMNELGIIVDLSHCGRETTNDGIKFSKTGASLNHTMCEALYKDHPRAKTDKQIRSMADKGGVMGVICLGYMIGPDPVKVGGIDHVGVASDFAIQGLQADGATRENWYEPRLTMFKPSYQVRWPPWIPELDSPERHKYISGALEKRGYKAEEIEKILGRNWLRYFNETLKS